VRPEQAPAAGLSSVTGYSARAAATADSVLVQLGNRAPGFSLAQRLEKAAQFGAGRPPELGGVHDLDVGDPLAVFGQAELDDGDVLVRVERSDIGTALPVGCGQQPVAAGRACAAVEEAQVVDGQGQRVVPGLDGQGQDFRGQSRAVLR
jgi:hypothetical protein